MPQCGISTRPKSAKGQKPALPRRSIAVRFAPNKRTVTERVQCDVMCQLLVRSPPGRTGSLVVSSRGQPIGDAAHASTQQVVPDCVCLTHDKVELP
jgi:hypothetical protein